jgi:hypothetical protein
VPASVSGSEGPPLNTDRTPNDTTSAIRAPTPNRTIEDDPPDVVGAGIVGGLGIGGTPMRGVGRAVAVSVPRDGVDAIEEKLA